MDASIKTMGSLVHKPPINVGPKEERSLQK